MQVSVCVFCVAHQYTSGRTVALHLSVLHFTSNEQVPGYMSHRQHLAEQGSDVGLPPHRQYLLRRVGINTRMTTSANRKVKNVKRCSGG